MTGKQTCRVSVVDDDGKRWTMEIEAQSVFYAIFAYNSQQRAGQHRNYPELTPDLPVEVELADGRKWTRTIGQAMSWAKRMGW